MTTKFPSSFLLPSSSSSPPANYELVPASLTAPSTHLQVVLLFLKAIRRFILRKDYLDRRFPIRMASGNAAEGKVYDYIKPGIYLHDHAAVFQEPVAAANEEQRAGVV